MGDSKFVRRDNQQRKTETTGKRPTSYSNWHRKSLSAECLAVDVDFVEYRLNRGIVGLFAVTGECNDENHIKNSKRFIWNRTKVERQVLVELSQKVGCPAYFVIHDNDLTVFHVHDLSEDLKDYTRMDNKEYSEFIEKL
ncbi:hypothetical protein PNF31_27495 [Priestia megaterium]|uniref:hypothetical protein n=1 Tax=Priestia megaterium TaxID=1404 RepID=UPI00234E9B0C|nr:hypothetical protein [Priestia megaterium]MDC7724449.1 hypothetical protein [Priestia megaterium]